MRTEPVADDFYIEPPQYPQIEIGTVGWEDEDLYYDKGTDEEGNGGYTLVRVQLFRGRDITKPLKPEIGQGHRLLCKISSGIFRIPKKGTLCYVAIPMGMEKKPGAGCIIACVEKNPTIQFDAGRVHMGFPDEDLIIKAKSVTISDYEDNFMGVSPASGVKFSTSAGALCQLKGGRFITIAPTSIASLIGNDGEAPHTGITLGQHVSMWAGNASQSGAIKINGSDQTVTISGTKASLAAGTVALGAAAVMPACIFPMSPSTTVFLQP